MTYAKVSHKLTTKQYELWERLIYLSNRSIQLPPELQAFIRPRRYEANTMERFHNILAIWASLQDKPEAVLASLARLG